jgi:hypothetical protein
LARRFEHQESLAESEFTRLPSAGAAAADVVREVANPQFGDIGDTALQASDLSGGAAIIGTSNVADATFDIIER